jgi:hypothetical protein
MESVNCVRFAGQAVTVSFYAKADSSRNYTSRFVQNFGSGGSSEVVTSTGATHALTTSWQRFTVSVAVPSVSGKTIGTSSYLAILLDGPSNTANTLDVWGFQIEYGSKATPFQTATGTIQGELAACLRYYENNYSTGNFPGQNIGAVNPGDQSMSTAQVAVTGVAGSARSRSATVPYQQIKRAQPTIRYWDAAGNLSKYTAADVNGSYISNNNAFDAFGGFANQSLRAINWQTVAASVTHIYCGIFWEASAEL